MLQFREIKYNLLITNGYILKEAAPEVQPKYRYI